MSRQGSYIRNPLFFNESCRYCLEEHIYGDLLCNMCYCRGSIKWYHQSCLRETFKYKPNKTKYVCELCNQMFRGKLFLKKKFKSVCNPFNKNVLNFK